MMIQAKFTSNWLSGFRENFQISFVKMPNLHIRETITNFIDKYNNKLISINSLFFLAHFDRNLKDNNEWLS